MTTKRTMETSDVAASAIDETTWLHRPYHGCIGRVAASAIGDDVAAT